MSNIEHLLKTYPFNLLLEIQGDEDKVEMSYLKGFYNALDTLMDREKEILKLRYLDGFTYSKIGEIYGVTQERIRKIIVRAIRKLKHPSRRAMYEGVPFKRLLDVKQELYQIRGELDNLKRAYDLLVGDESSDSDISELARYSALMEKPIEELNLSARPYYLLRRAGLDTVGKIIEVSEYDLLKIQGMGKKSIEEIVEELGKYGLKLRR